MDGKQSCERLQRHYRGWRDSFRQDCGHVPGFCLLGTFNSIIAVFVFLATKAFFSIVGNRWETFNRFVAYFGSLSFGIMLIEHICRRTTTQLYDFLVRSFPPFLSCWMWILSAYLMGVAIVSVMKIIPCVKKLI